MTAPPSPTDRVQAMCGDLIDALPETVADDLDARDVDPSDALAAAWGDPAVVLRCGVPKPDALTRTSACFEVDGVGWLATQDGREVSGDAPVEGTLTFTTIGRAAYVEVEVPADGRPPARRPAARPGHADPADDPRRPPLPMTPSVFAWLTSRLHG